MGKLADPVRMADHIQFQCVVFLQHYRAHHELLLPFRNRLVLGKTVTSQDVIQGASLRRVSALRKGYVVSDDKENRFDELPKRYIQGV